jgi:hypothetical protein
MSEIAIQNNLFESLLNAKLPSSSQSLEDELNAEGEKYIQSDDTQRKILEPRENLIKEAVKLIRSSIPQRDLMQIYVDMASHTLPELLWPEYR